MAFLFSLGWAMTDLAAEEIKGEARVISGNEIVIGKRTVRLFGVAAPGLEETCQIHDAKARCGIIAWAELIKLADGQVISCDVESASGKAQAGGGGSVFGTCYSGETDLNEAMALSGWAKAVPEQSDRYVGDETDAKQSRRGVWTDYDPSRAGLSR